MLVLILDLLERLLERSGGDLGPFRVLDYITFRSAMALILAFVISLKIGPRVIHRLRALKAGQPIRQCRGAASVDLSAMHGKKSGTPTMGGLIILFAMVLPVLLLCRLTNFYVILLMAMALGYGALGFHDDYLKVAKKNHKGLSPRQKLVIQAGLGAVLGLALWLGDWPVYYEHTGAYGYDYLTVPFFKNSYWHLGPWYVPFVMLVMVCTSNAVNLTDGLDGLAIGVSIASLSPFVIITYMASRHDLARYLYIPHIPGGGEIVVFLAALLGACMGFLWFNAHPAQVFMGDTGSMMLGGVLGTTAVLVKQELLLVVIGGIFVVESLSVMIQVSIFKLTGTRIFRMSPLHHHFERLGVHESTIIIRFWVISWLLALAGLAMLKLR